MISKKRLEELIKQGATIYCPYYMYYDGVELDNQDYVDDEFLYIFRQVWKKESGYDKFRFRYLFETKEEAEFALKYKNIERTDTLNLPTWEEFDEQKFVWFVDKNQRQCCLYYLNRTDKIFINVNGDVINIGELNKGNYLKACEVAKKLFLGD